MSSVESAAFIVVETDIGDIVLRLRRDAAPETAKHIASLCSKGLYDSTSFYRADFVVQMGLHGTGKESPSLAVNETNTGVRVSNTRGTAAVAHWDIPDCGKAEFFINLRNNAHLDEAYGGYCVFAQVEDDASFEAVDKLAQEIKAAGKVRVNRCYLRP